MHYQRYITFALFLLMQVTLSAQTEGDAENLSEIVIDGKYSGRNLYVLNPDFCVQSVSINGKDYPFTSLSNAFEIALENHNIDDYVFVQITYKKSYNPLVINEESLIKESEFPCASFLYSKKKKLLEWKIEELNNACEYQLEQLLYGKWIVIKELGKPDEIISNIYLPVMLSGINLFRIKQKDPFGQELTSPIVKVKSPNLRVMLLNDKVKEYIEFTAVTHYELFDENGFFIKRGTAQKVNVADLKKGTYWINFDGKETMITKK